jgi:hypothetical protein
MANPGSLFLSHSGADKPKLIELVKRLKVQDITLWFDAQIQLAEAIPSWMSDGLGKADRFLIAWSDSAKDSPHVWNELEAFYMRKPYPGDILFFRLDGTPIPALFAPRRFLRSSANPQEDATSITQWLCGNDPEQAQVDVLPATEDLVKMVPKGPRVPSHWITADLVEAYAGLLNKANSSTTVIDKAIALRIAADPGDPTVTPIGLAELPSFDYVGAEAFWGETLRLACLKGPRMLAALLFAQSDELFSDKARSDRASILQRLRNGAQPGGINR